MSSVADESAIIDQTKELCKKIAESKKFQTLLGEVETFLHDDDARLTYQSVHERGHEMHKKQHAGVELSKVEIQEFETAREALFENQITKNFMNAQQELENLTKTINQYVKMTLELGRVPTEEDLASVKGEGCCGGDGKGGCGCH